MLESSKEAEEGKGMLLLSSCTTTEYTLLMDGRGSMRKLGFSKLITDHSSQ